MDLASELVGAGLSLLGGFAATLFASTVAREREERELLFKLHDQLIDYGAVLKGALAVRMNAAEEQRTLSQVQLLLDEVTRRSAIASLGLRLTRRKFRSVAVRISKLALDEQFRTLQNVETVQRAITQLVNRRMVDRYHSDIESKPNTF